jgi:hypothetical protein
MSRLNSTEIVSEHIARLQLTRLTLKNSLTGKRTFALVARREGDHRRHQVVQQVKQPNLFKPKLLGSKRMTGGQREKVKVNKAIKIERQATKNAY